MTQLLNDTPGTRRGPHARYRAWGPCRADCEPLPPPTALTSVMPLGSDRETAVDHWRTEVRAVLNGTDDRLLILAGPCSIHDPGAAADYACWLAKVAAVLRDDLLIIMRAYFEKPRTSTGWRGLTTDPHMDGSSDIGDGLSQARGVLLDIADAGIGAATEWVDPLDALYLGDAITWGAIGARTVESQAHRMLASALPMPVGFKNGTSGGAGSVEAAVNACVVASAGQAFKAVSPCGRPVKVTSRGNPDCHVVLRGGASGPNYAAPHVEEALGLLAAVGLPRRVVADAAHGNSLKDYRRQPVVAGDVAVQVADGQRGLVGVMIESFFQAGRQEPGNPAGLAYGQSVTDECMDTAMTLQVMEALASAARARRTTRGRWS